MNRLQFLKRFVGIAGFGFMPLSEIFTKRKIYLLQCFVAGFRFNNGMELLELMEVNDVIELKREPNNEHDTSAIALYWQQEKIGYVPADNNLILAKLLDAEALPLFAIITHLNKKVKPWENVSIAIYFLQEEKKELHPHALYLQNLYRPHYTSLKKNTSSFDYEEFFENPNRIIDFDVIDAIKDEEAKNYFTKYLKKKIVYYKSKPHGLVNTNDIYVYMYNMNPIEWVVADDGEKYILFDFNENPFNV